MTVILAESFHLNGHTTVFCPQIQTLEPPYKTSDSLSGSERIKNNVTESKGSFNLERPVDET